MGLMKTSKTVWITGGGTGIGKSVAEQLADLGHNVIISGRRLQNLNKVKLYDRKRITVKVLDICSAKDCRKVVKSIDSKFGSIDLVILNAATYNPGKINFNNLKKIIDNIEIIKGDSIQNKKFEIPVCCEKEFSLDIKRLEEKLKMKEEKKDGSIINYILDGFDEN